MEQLILLRLSKRNSINNFGQIISSRGLICHTLELPWLNNKQRDSCIPAASYVCKKIKSPKHGNVIEIMDVPNRTNILIHAGNTINDTEGCVLVGSMVNKNSLVKSRDALQALLEKTQNEFILTIFDFFN